MSVLALRFDDDAAESRFTPLQIDGEWTVWDAALQRYVVHEATWDAQAAHDVAETLVGHPGYAHIWTWSDDLEVG